MCDPLYEYTVWLLPYFGKFNFEFKYKNRKWFKLNKCGLYVDIPGHLRMTYSRTDRHLILRRILCGTIQDIHIILNVTHLYHGKRMAFPFCMLQNFLKLIHSCSIASFATSVIISLFQWIRKISFKMIWQK